MSLARVVAQSGLSSRVCKLMAICLGIKNKEPKHVPRRLRTRTIRVETSGSGSFIMSVHAKNDMTVTDLRQIVADFKNMHITMIGFTEGHGGSIIYDDSRQLRLFPKNMIFVSYVKSAIYSPFWTSAFVYSTKTCLSSMGITSSDFSPTDACKSDTCNSEDVHQKIEQLLFGASYTSSRRRKTSKSQQTAWYNNHKSVKDVRVQKRTKKSHR